MSIASLVRDGAVLTDASAKVLGRIVEPDVHLAIWARRFPEALTVLRAIDWETIDDIDETVAVETLADGISALIEAAGFPGGARAALAQELLALTIRFGAIMGCTLLRLRLEVVETDACRRFHSDIVTARLLMPLVGPGKQWIHAGTDGPVHDVRPGEVAVFKGRLWANEPKILHRSPPIAETGQTRLLFALNPIVENETA